MKKILKTEQQQICRGHPMYKTIEDFCIRSNNLYNYALYTVRQEFINNGNYLNYHCTQRMLKDSEPYKALMSQASQCVLQVLDRNWKSYFVAIKDWQKNMYKYLGMPKLPNYHKKGARFTWFLKNNQTYIKDDRLYFKLKCMNGYSFKVNPKGRLYAVRFVPKNGIFILEVIYQCEIEEKTAYNDNVLGIDLGVNNFVTMTNNIGLQPIIINGKGIKSINQYYNKQRAMMTRELQIRNGQHWSNRLDKLNLKRFNRIKNYIHNTSSYIISYCIKNKIDNIVIGRNKEWKQGCVMNDKATQNFVFIPYDMLIKQLEYKGLWSGVRIITHDESYTSGTSFLDGEEPTKEYYDKTRRKHRGLFVSNNGTQINADVNGSFQIIKKVFPNAFVDGIEGSLTPVVINACKV